MNCKLSLSQLIETFSCFSIITLLAVIAERSDPGGHEHFALLAIVGALLVVHAASGCISDHFVRGKQPEESNNQDMKDGEK